MPANTFHFLNVKEGDCSIIEHLSGHVSVVDVNNARHKTQGAGLQEALVTKGGSGNHNQKANPENPVNYLKRLGVTGVFRFMLSHPDMDHMDGIKDFFEEFRPANFYDIDNEENKEFSEDSPYREDDWLFYRDNLRDKRPQSDPKYMQIYSGDDREYRTRDWNGNPPGDGLYVLAPTPSLVGEAKNNEDFNDASYVVLYWGEGGRVLLSGDSHDKTWEHVLDNWGDWVKDVELLIAPHHGRKSGRSYGFLDVVNPKMTFFGNARSEHLAYDAWRNRDLEYITNNQAGSMKVNCTGGSLTLYIANENFARDKNPDTWYSSTYDGWYVKEIV